MKFDYHTHHNRCGHATGTVRDYVIAAIEKGLQVIGISDHTPAFALEEDLPWPGGAMAKSEFPAYVDEVLALKKEFAGQIDVMLGIEADFLPDSLDIYRSVIASYPFDYVIGSIHNFGGISIYDGEYWDGLDQAGKLATKNLYYDYVSQSAKSGLYDILGHVDALKRYFPGYSGLWTEALDFTLQTVAASDVVLEINTSDDNCVPDTAFLERALFHGVKVTIGSDAHEPERVGDQFEEVRKNLQAIGYREWATFHKRVRTMVSLDQI
ncbi:MULTISPECIES: histidinol-phosphatase HisJ family protein [Paenibacillus]|uniref:Histidinol-phosphatase n=1 Tax=Paenibacillus odorifer TaxID=189426 RepID=A0A1R0XD74_9BACL|nr:MULTISPECIES: histidinol-phosphatase HisJ family protein [Paenibacillus]AIQ73100.1 phosphoesterase [Paenibacillus odorifer]ETT69022.1 histidinol-phosphatase [Paenibacillus sp. FSL H8-237]OMC94260.1 phosphoesterase [Paenibacillus odorifer]OMC99959.1 phosphoesterase [Paenibacillus odorifer]OMD16624.1 phosphoesterase [Paenibacillus odorifer]